MVGRGMVLAGLLGVVALHQCRELPGGPQMALGLLVPLAAGAVAHWRPRGTIVPHRAGRRRLLLGLSWGLLAWWLGFCLTAVWAQLRLAQQLDPSNVDKVSRVVVRVASLPRLQVDRISFDAEVLQAHPSGVPQTIRVNWPAPGWRGPYAEPAAPDPPFPEVYPGQIWRMALILRPILGAHNPGGFDYEAHAFAQGLRATGTVRGSPTLLDDDPWHDLAIVADRARHAVRKAMAPWLEGYRYGPVLRALAIGDQDGVDDADWLVFNRSGLTHLVSISGSHITMLSGAAAWWVSVWWRRLTWRGRCLSERWPARRAAACAALLVAWLYCLLAGWGVPAQRTFLMLAVVAGAQALQLRISATRVLALAAVIVVAFDPWSILTSGFWLSFTAVAVLFAVGKRVDMARTIDRMADGHDPQEIAASGVESPPAGVRRPGQASRLVQWRRALGLAAHLQLAVTFALAPFLAWLFHEISLVSPVANAYAIPLIEMVVTPLSLLLAAVSLVPGMELVPQGLAWLAHAVLETLMVPTEWLAALPTWWVPQGPSWLYLVAAAGAGLALYPQRLFPYQRTLPWLAFLPMLLWVTPRPGPGEWNMLALDVGQGSALLVQTARHTLLFDAGARQARDSDEGARTLLPTFKALGVDRLDVLVLSHADLDHAGGAHSVLHGVHVEQSYSNFALRPWLKQQARRLAAPVPTTPWAMVPCLFGDRWEVDGVHFEFLWPLEDQPVRSGSAANADSCVLRIRGRWHSALLTGDITQATEATLVRRGLGPVDVVVAAHHGSRTSSSAEFIEATAARHVIMQAGRWNRYGHPDDAVVRRWEQSGSHIWRTDRHGAVQSLSRKTGLSLYSVLESSRRYWHGQRP